MKAFPHKFRAAFAAFGSAILFASAAHADWSAVRTGSKREAKKLATHPDKTQGTPDTAE